MTVSELTAAEFEARLQDPPHRLLYDYWRERTKVGRLPGRGDIDPVEIPSVLRYLILADVSAARETVRFRLVGTEMQQFWGSDFSGKSIEEIMTGEYLRYIKGLFLDCARLKAPVLGNSRFQWDTGRLLATRRLYLPLAADGKTVDMVLVCQVFDLSAPSAIEATKTIGPPVRFEELDRKVAAG